jgi:hypothetical protein
MELYLDDRSVSVYGERIHVLPGTVYMRNREALSCTRAVTGLHDVPFVCMYFLTLLDNKLFAALQHGNDSPVSSLSSRPLTDLTQEV